MKVLTIAGTRPEWIRLSRVIPKLDSLCDHVVVDTGQNYDVNLRDVFFKELGIRKPNYRLKAIGTFGQQLGVLAPALEEIIRTEKPDAFLVLGDTNSSLGAIIAKRMGVRVFHMEAGNRCFDERVPEEINRRIIDHSSDILMPYTERSRQNLLDEGIPSKNIYVTGNPIYEVLNHYADKIVFPDASFTGGYYLVTLHRAENVDSPLRLMKIVSALNALDKMVLWPVHPRTRSKLGKYQLSRKIKLLSPAGFLEFVGLYKEAYCVLTDSGTVQEECAIIGKPVVTLRDSTERPETLEVGSNVIAGCEVDDIMRGITVALSSKGEIPVDYDIDNVSDVVAKIVLSYWL